MFLFCKSNCGLSHSNTGPPRTENLQYTLTWHKNSSRHGLKNIQFCRILYENRLRELCFFFANQTVPCHIRTRDPLEQNTIQQQITQTQLPNSLVLLKPVITVKGKNESDPARHKGVLGKWRYGSTLNHCTTWRWVIHFPPRQLYPRGKKKIGTHGTVGWVSPESGSGRY
jgi:hypothetical protein